MTKTRTSRLLSMLLCVCMVFLCIPGMSFRAGADVTQWKVGDSINLAGKAFCGDDTSDSCSTWMEDTCDVTTPEYRKTYNQWVFRAVLDGDNLWLTPPAGKTASDVPTGFKIKSGSGTLDDPYTFELVYGSSTPATTDVSFVRATSAEELETNLPNIPSYTREQAEAWVEANKTTLAPAYAAHMQAHSDALFVVVYAISEDTYYVLQSGYSDLKSFVVNNFVLSGLKYNFTNYYDMIYYPEVTAATHTHTWGYNASGATITANCTGTGTCDITEGLTLTISAPASTSLTYDGTAKTAALSTGYNTTAFPDTYTIEYYKGTAKLDSAPADAGTYTAKVTAGTATASVDFTITPKTVSSPAITLSPESCIYDGTAKEPAVTVKDGTTTIPESEYDVSYSDNTNVGTAKVTVTDKTGGNYVVSGEKTFTIAKAEPAFTAPLAVADLIYTGDEQELVTQGTTEDGTMEYSLDGNSYSEDIPTAVNVGSYTVYWRITGDNNHSDKAPSTLTVSIAKADSDALSPMPVQGLVYTGEEQALLTVPTGNAVVYYYKLTDDGGNDITDYSTEIPTGTDAGMYNVTWYAEGDDNHNDSVPETITVSIAKADPVVTAPHAADDLKEYGHPHALVKGGTTSGGAIWYSLDGGDFSTDIPIATEAGTYTVTWMVMGDDNYNGTVDETIYVVIAAKEEGTFPVPAEDGSAPVYYSAVKAPSGAAPSLVAGVSEEEEMLTWNAELSGTTLTWDAKDGADGYVISIRGKGDKAFRRLDRVTEKSAVLSNLKPGTYIVYVRYEKDGKLAKCRQSARAVIEIG